MKGMASKASGASSIKFDDFLKTSYEGNGFKSVRWLKHHIWWFLKEILQWKWLPKRQVAQIWLAGLAGPVQPARFQWNHCFFVVFCFFLRKTKKIKNQKENPNNDDKPNEKQKKQNKSLILAQIWLAGLAGPLQLPRFP